MVRAFSGAGSTQEPIELGAAELGSGEEVGTRVTRQAGQCTFSGDVRLRVLSWSLGHATARWQDLAAALSGWEWDVALLRHLPPRWPVPVATALDAEFRCAPRPGGGGSMLSRLLAVRRDAEAGARVGTAVILARRDRLVAQWPADPRHSPRVGAHAARLACGIWVGNLASRSRALKP